MPNAQLTAPAGNCRSQFVAASIAGRNTKAAQTKDEWPAQVKYDSDRSCMERVLPPQTFATIVIPTLIALWSAAASAEMLGSDYKPCAEKSSTMEIVDCVKAGTKVCDDRLNAAYRDLLKRITPDQRQPLMQAEQL
jgi:hypothetical protein